MLFSAICLLFFSNLKKVTSQALLTFFKNYSNSIHFTHDFQSRGVIVGLFFIVLGFFLISFFKKIAVYLVDIQYLYLRYFNFFKMLIKRQFSKRQLKYTLCFFIIFIFSICIRLFYLNSPLSYDEGFTYYHYSKHPFFIIMTYYDYPNNHIFHTLLVRGSNLIFGNNIFALRLPALLSGIFLIPLVYLYVGKFFNKNSGLLAAILVSFSAILISYSVNARGYSILFCFFISLLVLIELLRKNENKFIWFLFVLIQVIGMYTIPTMMYTSLLVYVYFLMSEYYGGKKEFRVINMYKIFLSGLIVLLITLIIYLPVYLFMGLDNLIRSEYGFTSNSMFITLNKIGFNLIEFSKFCLIGMPFSIKLLFFIGVIISGLVYKKCKHLLIAILILFLFVFFVQGVFPYFRVLLFITPLLACISSIGIVKGIQYFTRSKTYLITLITSFCLITILLFQIIELGNPEKTPIDNPKAFYKYLHQNLKSNDRLLFCFPIEASVYGYFSFYHFSEDYFTNLLDKSKKVYIITSIEKRQSVDFVLGKNDIKPKVFRKQFTYLTKKRFNPDAIIYVFKKKKNVFR